jgi:hypothetical protein
MMDDKLMCRWEGIGDHAWVGLIDSDYPEVIENAPWEELYHEEDYRGIAYQLLAEDLGLPTI